MIQVHRKNARRDSARIYRWPNRGREGMSRESRGAARTWTLADLKLISALSSLVGATLMVNGDVVD